MKKIYNQQLSYLQWKSQAKTQISRWMSLIQEERPILKFNYSLRLSRNSPPFNQSNFQCRTHNIIRLCYILSSSRITPHHGDSKTYFQSSELQSIKELVLNYAMSARKHEKSNIKNHSNKLRLNSNVWLSCFFFSPSKQIPGK